MITRADESRASFLIARLRHQQLELALSSSIRESAHVADRVRRVREAILHMTSHRKAPIKQQLAFD